MAPSKVDPAALLLAVLAAAGPPLFEPGAWSWLNTVVAGTALVVITSYALSGEARRGYTNDYQRWGVALVVGLIATVTIAWPVQDQLIARKVWGWAGEDFYADRATSIALLIGLAITVSAFSYLRRVTSFPQANNRSLDSRVATLEQENANLRARHQELVDLLTEWLERSR